MNQKCYCGRSDAECGLENAAVIRTRIRHGIERKVFQCGECKLVFLEPKTEDLREYYREQYRRDYSPSVEREMNARETFDMYRPYMDERAERVSPHLSGDMSVLEIGCATGHFLDALEPHVGRRQGIEYNESHAAFVRDELDIPCYTTPIEESGIEEDSLDMIFMFHVFEHVENPTEFMAGMGRYLSDRGKIYIEVPNIDDALIEPYTVAGYADFYYREPHLFYFSSTTLTQVARTAGFSGEIEMIQRYSLLNHLHWVSTGQPMADAEMGMRVPTFVDAPDDFTAEANAFLAEADTQYRNLLKQHGKAEAMAFLGTPVH